MLATVRGKLLTIAHSKIAEFFHGRLTLPSFLTTLPFLLWRRAGLSECLQDNVDEFIIGLHRKPL